MRAGKGDLDQTGGTAMKLKKSPGTMTSKERVLRTFHHEKADRVPISYFANPGIQKRVAAYLGVPQDRDSVNDALGVDFKGLMPAYTGKPLFTAPGPELPRSFIFHLVSICAWPDPFHQQMPTVEKADASFNIKRNIPLLQKQKSRLLLHSPEIQSCPAQPQKPGLFQQAALRF